jgi:hypothetical protein
MYGMSMNGKTASNSNQHRYHRQRRNRLRGSEISRSYSNESFFITKCNDSIVHILYYMIGVLTGYKSTTSVALYNDSDSVDGIVTQHLQQQQQPSSWHVVDKSSIRTSNCTCPTGCIRHTHFPFCDDESCHGKDKEHDERWQCWTRNIDKEDAWSVFYCPLCRRFSVPFCGLPQRCW